MKKYKKITVALLLSLMCLLVAFKSSSGDDVKSTFLKMAISCQEEIQRLNEMASRPATWGRDCQELQEQLVATRLAYKRVEFLLEFYYPEHIKAYINGAPLRHVDPYPYEEVENDGYYPGGAEAYVNSLPLDYLEDGNYRTDPVVVDPQGLQVLDEIIFGEESPDVEELQKLTAALEMKFNILVEALEFRKLYFQFELIEASRLEFIRVFSLGVSGYDTPGSLNAVDEAKAALEGVHAVVDVAFENDPLKANILSKLDKSIAFLQQPWTFDNFDRMTFLKEHINPLYKGFKEFHDSRKLEYTSELVGMEQSWNSKTTNLFDEDLLNPFYYSMVKRSENFTDQKNIGKKLFYDNRLSGDGKLSCASCHKPELAFSDGVPLSHSSVEGQFVSRNAPGLINAVFADRFFYNLRAYDLPDQANHVIENHLEFNTTLKEIVEKMNQDEGYKKMFAKIYGEGNEITHPQFSEALACYVMSITSQQSPFDKYVRNEIRTIDKKVVKGFNLFMGKAACGTCHFAPTFSGLVPPRFVENESEVLGVLTAPGSFEVDGDLGRIENGVLVDKFDIYNHSFKTTTVRNVSFTAPYFHNGAYPTLKDVVEFYNHGGGAGLGLTYELPNQTLPSDSLGLTVVEQNQIISFLESLADEEAVSLFSK